METGRKSIKGLLMACATIALAVGLSLQFDAGEANDNAIPQFPHVFFGQVTIGGFPSGDDVKIEVFVNGVNYAVSIQNQVSTTDTTSESDSSYGTQKNFQVAADDPDTAALEGGADGDVIEFFVRGVSAQAKDPANGSLVNPVLFVRGGVTRLDLSVPLSVESETTETIEPDAETVIDLPGNEGQIVVDAGSIPEELSANTVEIELTSYDTDTVPSPPLNTVLVRAIEVNTIVDGSQQEVTYTQPVELVFPLTQSDIDLVGNDTDNLKVVRYNEGTGVWDVLPTTFEPVPAPGQLVTTLTSFSLFAVSASPSDTPPPDPTSTPAPTASPAPTATPGSGGGGGGGGGPSITPEIAFRPDSLTFLAVEGADNPEPQLLEVWTSRNRSNLRFTLSTEALWLSMDPEEELSEEPGDKEDIEVSVDTSGLGTGRHTASIIIEDDDAANHPQLVPVTLIVSKALAPGASRVTIVRDSAGELSTLDGRVRVKIPAAALPSDEERDVNVEVRGLDVDTVPNPPEDSVFIQAVEIHTVVDGEESPISYLQPVELEFLLSEEDLKMAEGDGDRFRVLWSNDASGSWDAIPSEFEADGANGGRLTASLDHFSTYAVAILNTEAESSSQQTVPTATGTPKPATSPSAPSVEAPVVGLTRTSVPSTPTPQAPSVSASVTPVPAVTPSPVPTEVVVAVVTEQDSTPEAQQELVISPEPGGGIGTTTIVILVVVGIAVVGGGFGVFQALNARRREQ